MNKKIMNNNSSNKINKNKNKQKKLKKIWINNNYMIN